EGEAKDDLGGRATVAAGDVEQFGMGQRRAVGGQQGEALIDQVMGGAEFSDAAIPASDGIAAVLDKTGADACLLAQALELLEAHVADAEEASAAAVVNRV